MTLIVALIAAGGPTGTAVFALITSNKDDIARRLDCIEGRLDLIAEKVNNNREWVIRLEERAGIVVR